MTATFQAGDGVAGRGRPCRRAGAPKCSSSSFRPETLPSPSGGFADGGNSGNCFWGWFFWGAAPLSPSSRLSLLAVRFADAQHNTGLWVLLWRKQQNVVLHRKSPPYFFYFFFPFFKFKDEFLVKHPVKAKAETFSREYAWSSTTAKHTVTEAPKKNKTKKKQDFPTGIKHPCVEGPKRPASKSQQLFLYSVNLIYSQTTKLTFGFQWFLSDCRLIELFSQKPNVPEVRWSKNMQKPEIVGFKQKIQTLPIQSCFRTL